MKVKILFDEGPSVYRVYQRRENDMATIPLKGNIIPTVDGILNVSVYDEGSKRFVGQNSFRCDNGLFNGQLNNLPVGDYTVKLELQNHDNEIMCSKSIKHIAVGDLYLLAGQSNMEGAGKLINLEKPSNKVRCLSLDDKWNIARDPLCWLNESVDSAYWSVPAEQRAAAAKKDRYFRSCGAGLGVRFGKEMNRFNNVPVGLIVCPKGATSMLDWDPQKAHLGGESLYGALLRRVKKAGGTVKACLWYQGESDATIEYAPFYRQRFHQFIECLRRDLNRPELPVLYVQLASGVEAWILEIFPKWKDIQSDQLLIENECGNIVMAAAIDSTFADGIHIDTASQRRMGTRLALLAKRMCFGDQSINIGPRPKEFIFDNKERTLLRVVYDGVNGHLVQEPRIFGFSAQNDGNDLIITDCKVDKNNKNHILLKFDESVPENSMLWYSKDIINSVCNLKDDLGLAAPVFGPIKV